MSDFERNAGWGGSQSLPRALGETEFQRRGSRGAGGGK